MDMEGYETLKEALDYSQKQVSAAQAEIVRLKKDLAKARDLLKKSAKLLGLLPRDPWECLGQKLVEAIEDELAKE